MAEEPLDKREAQKRLIEAAELITPEMLLAQYKVAVSNAIKRGELTGKDRAIEAIRRLEDLVFNDPDQARKELTEHLEEMGQGIPEENKVRRSYTMTEAALEARRLNAQNSTGPRTPEGKKKSSRNGLTANWKHGQYSRSVIRRVMGVCTEQCEKYPCPAVGEEKTARGELCLDAEGLAGKVNTLITAAQSGDIKDVNELSNMLLAMQHTIIERMQRAVIEDGTMVKEALIDKEGNIISWKLKNHPHILPLMDALKKLGLDFSTMRFTPEALQKTKDVEDAGRALADAFGSAATALMAARKQKGENADSDG